MKRFNLSLIGILIGATLLRLYNLTTLALWHDEAFSALLIKYPIGEMFYRIGLDVHPPFYYVALRLWHYVLGDSLLSLRGFSVFFGVLTVYAIYLFVKAAFKNERIALAAALLVAINPFQIQYVTEARMYTLGTFLVAISAYFIVKAFETENKKFWLALAITTSMAMYTHYYLYFSVLATGLFGLYYAIRKYRSNIKQYWNFVWTYLLALVLYIPWLKTFNFQFSQVQDNYWIPKMDTWSVWVTNFRLITGSGADPTKQMIRIILVISALITVFLIYRIIKKNQTDYKWLVLLGFLVPFIGAVLLSLKQSIYLDRYFLFAALFYTTAIGIFIFEIERLKVRYFIFAVAIAVSLINFGRFWTELGVKDKPGMAAAAEYLNNNVEENNKINLGSSFEYFNFKYYNKTGVKPLLYTPGITSVHQLPHFSGTALLNDDDLITDFNSNVKPGDTTWTIWTNAFGGSKPTPPKNWVEISEKSWQDTHPYPGTWIVVTQYKVR